MSSFDIPVGKKIQIFDEGGLYVATCVLVMTAKDMFCLIDVNFWNRWDDPTFIPNHKNSVTDKELDTMINSGSTEKYSWKVV